MNCGQFKDALCYLCLAGSMVTSWSLTQDVGGSNNPYKNFMDNSIQQSNLKCGNFGMVQILY